MSARVALGVAVVASAVGAVRVAQGPGRLTTYAGHSSLAATLTFLAGAALVLAGLALSFEGSSGRIGDLTQLAGVVWFAPVWVGWDEGPPLVRSIGMVAAGFTLPLLIHVVLAYPGGRVRTVLGRAVLGAAYLFAVLAVLGRALFYDPFDDQYCWANCTDNVFLLRSLPDLARSIDVMDQWFAVAVAGGFVGLCVWRVLTSSAPARRILLRVTVPAILFAASVAIHAVARRRVPLEDPSEPVFLVTYLVGCAALILLAAGLVWGSLLTRLQRRAVSRFVSSLGEAPPPGSLEQALASAVGDPELRIAYWLSDSGRFVDAYGQPVTEPATGPGRVVTTLVVAERRVALVSHAPGVPEIETAMGAASRMALDNERLQAEGLSQLDELRASRTRIVEAGDRERRRLERDLHDGAQQRLLAASYDIRLARSSADSDDDPPTVALTAHALEGTEAALDELRELAHGIYPAILGEAGLVAALATLADTAPLRLETRDVTEERYPAPVETSAYLLVVDALEDAAARNATQVTVSTGRLDGRLVLAVDDDGSGRTSAMVRSADRVGALGGTLDVGARLLQAELPCA
jgi:signal transduction histidine kinase